jgi:hypothetical protein
MAVDLADHLGIRDLKNNKRGRGYNSSPSFLKRENE